MLFLSGNLSLSLLLLLRISHTYLLRRRFSKGLYVSVCFVEGSLCFVVGFFFFFHPGSTFRGSTSWHTWWTAPGLSPNTVWCACPGKVRQKLSDGRNLPFGPSHFIQTRLAGSYKRIRTIGLTNDTPKSGIVSDLFWWPSSSGTNQNSSVSQRCPLGSSICQQFGSRASRLVWVEEGWGFLCLGNRQRKRTWLQRLVGGGVIRRNPPLFCPTSFSSSYSLSHSGGDGAWRRC